MFEKLIFNFIRIYKNEINKYDDYLNFKKRSKLVKKN